MNTELLQVATRGRERPQNATVPAVSVDQSEAYTAGIRRYGREQGELAMRTMVNLAAGGMDADEAFRIVQTAVLEAFKRDTSQGTVLGNILQQLAEFDWAQYQQAQPVPESSPQPVSRDEYFDVLRFAIERNAPQQEITPVQATSFPGTLPIYPGMPHEGTVVRFPSRLVLAQAA